jgi:hypothetical protein
VITTYLGPSDANAPCRNSFDVKELWRCYKQKRSHRHELAVAQQLENERKLTLKRLSILGCQRSRPSPRRYHDIFLLLQMLHSLAVFMGVYASSSTSR